MTRIPIPMQLTVSEGKDGASADLYIYGEINKGFQLFGYSTKQESDTDATDVVKALSDLSDAVDEIRVHINSFGGSVAEGVAIYNTLKSHPAKVTTICEGFACSVASVIFMAGMERVMCPASLLMLHNASMPASGTAADLRSAADALDTITGLSKTAYLAHATDKLTPEKLDEVMDAETWVRPETALEWGLATSVDEDDEQDSPTQSVARSVFDRLTGAEATLEALDVAQAAISESQIAAVVEQTIERLLTAEPARPAKETPRERYSRIFQQLSQE